MFILLQRLLFHLLAVFYFPICPSKSAYLSYYAAPDPLLSFLVIINESIGVDALVQPKDANNLKPTCVAPANDVEVEYPRNGFEQRSEKTTRGLYKYSIACRILRNHQFRNSGLGATGAGNIAGSYPYSLARNVLGCIASGAVREQDVEDCFQPADDESLPQQHHNSQFIKRNCTLRDWWSRFKKGIGKLSSNDAELLRLKNETLKAENVALRAKIKDLETRAVFFDNPGDEAWKESNTVQQYVAQVVSKAVAVSEAKLFARILHCDIGALVRQRKLEHRRSRLKKNTELIRQGDEAAHYGKAIADAMRYHPAIRNPRKDEETYTSTYGFTPFQVWIFRNCKPLIQMLDWYGSVIDWHHPSTFPHTAFAKAWPSDLFEKYKTAKPETVQEDFADGKQNELLQVLKAAYLKEEAANRAQHTR